MFVKPAADPERPGACLVVRDPVDPRRKLPPEGAEVPETQYWFQRLRDGDVIAAERQADEPEPAPPTWPESTRERARPAREA